jgi:hypothetical protein
MSSIHAIAEQQECTIHGARHRYILSHSEALHVGGQEETSAPHPSFGPQLKHKRSTAQNRHPALPVCRCCRRHVFEYVGNPLLCLYYSVAPTSWLSLALALKIRKSTFVSRPNISRPSSSPRESLSCFEPGPPFPLSTITPTTFNSQWYLASH